MIEAGRSVLCGFGGWRRRPLLRPRRADLSPAKNEAPSLISDDTVSLDESSNQLSSAPSERLYDAGRRGTDTPGPLPHFDTLSHTHTQALPTLHVPSSERLKAETMRDSEQRREQDERNEDPGGRQLTSPELGYIPIPPEFSPPDIAPPDIALPEFAPSKSPPAVSNNPKRSTRSATNCFVELQKAFTDDIQDLTLESTLESFDAERPWTASESIDASASSAAAFGTETRASGNEIQTLSSTIIPSLLPSVFASALPAVGSPSTLPCLERLREPVNWRLVVEARNEARHWHAGIVFAAPLADSHESTSGSSGKSYRGRSTHVSHLQSLQGQSSSHGGASSSTHGGALKASYKVEYRDAIPAHSIFNTLCSKIS